MRENLTGRISSHGNWIGDKKSESSLWVYLTNISITFTCAKDSCKYLLTTTQAIPIKAISGTQFYRWKHRLLAD